MNTTAKSVSGALAVAVVLGGVLFFWHRKYTPPPPPVAETVAISDFDSLQADLSKRVYNEYGGAAAGKDFDVIVATPDSSIGTLIRSGGSLPADSTDCVPAPMPVAHPHNHLFPDYTVTSDTAITANVGPNAVQALSSADLNLKSSSTLTYKIDNPQIQLMADNNVEDVTKTGNCQAYIKGHPGLRYIRGTVTGKITYTVKVDHPASAKMALMKDFGNIAVDDDPGNSTISISDTDSQPIVDLLMLFPAPVVAETTASATVPAPDVTPEVARMHHAVIPKPAGNAGPPQPIAVPKPLPPATPQQTQGSTAAATGTRVFVQADVLEPAASIATFMQQLKAAWPEATIVPQVERVVSTKMPEVAQVRFFNSDDQAIAGKCLGILKQKYPNARAVRIGLTSPKGQLEVWLPKFKG